MLSSVQLQALFASITAQQSQVDSLLYLQELCSDHNWETPVDTQLDAVGEAGEEEHIILKQTKGQQQKTLRVW